MPADDPPAPPGAPNPWLPFAALSAGLFMIMLDATVVNVAQARIRESLGTGLSGVQ